MNWQIFYTPHTDDETIGMAGAIVRAKDMGDSVLVCLVTDNRPSARGRRLFPMYDLQQQRRTEFRRALDILHVDELQTWELPESEMPGSALKMRSQIRDHMMNLHRDRQVVHHHTTWGMWDQNQGMRSLSHDLCASAAFELTCIERDARVSLYGIYEYSKPIGSRCAPTIVHLSKHEHAQKRDALHAYYPGLSSIGYGYTSVPELMDAARLDPREFIVEV